MSQGEHPSPVFSRRIPSDLAKIEEILGESRGYVRSLGIAETSSVRTVLRELLLNAVEHGNRGDRKKSVSCEIEPLAGNRFRVTVQDEGEGFDFASLRFELADPNQERQRGLILVNSFADEITFADGGRSVTAYLTVTGRTRYLATRDADGYQRISPTGCITAATAADLKQTLLDLFQKGHRDYRFDMAEVEDIDSVGISVMIALSNSLKAEQGETRLEMIHVSEECKELFRIIRLDSVYKIA
jgi:anti-anti-sigma factor